MTVIQRFCGNCKRLVSKISLVFKRKPAQKSLAMQQVVHAKQARKFPSWKQWRHFPSLLSDRERTIAGAALLIVLVSSFFLVRSFIDTQQTTIAEIGGTYTEGLVGFPQLINPLYASTSDVDTDLATLLYSGLTKFDPQEGYILDLASSYEVSENNTQYTFTIHENARWHSGDPVLTDDVIFTVSAIQNEAYRSPLATQFKGITVSQVDKRTVKFTLEEQDDDFLRLMSVGILPSRLWQEIAPSNAVLTQLNIKPIGSGPYVFSVLEKDERTGEIRSYTLERFNDYYGEGPYIKTITFKFYQDTTSALAALQNRNVEGLAFIPSEKASALEHAGHTQIMTAGLPEYVAAFFNIKKEPLDDIALRKALSFGVDKNALLDATLGDYVHSISSFILPNMPGSDAQISDVDYNTDLAESLLDQSGWTFVEENNTRQKDGKTLSLRIKTLNTQELTDVAQVLKEQWEALGVEITIEAIDASGFTSAILEKRDYDIVLAGEIYTKDLDPYAFWHSSQTRSTGLNLSRFESDGADDAIEQAQKAQTPEERAEAFIALQEQTLPVYPAVFLYQPLYVYAIADSIKGARIERLFTPADRFHAINTWYIKTSKKFE